MKNNKLLLRIATFMLTLVMLVSGQIWTAAAAAVTQDALNAKTYISEIKTFYGRNEAEVKKFCEAEGFILSKVDLNEGAAEPYKTERLMIGLGYKTTTDPGDAITDLTLLDMKNTHYEELDYKDFLDKHLDNFRNEAAQIMSLVNNFRQKYADGSPNALMTYDTLNLIYVDEDKPHDKVSNLLGEFLINSDKADIPFFEKYIQRGNAVILSRIVDLLSTAVADYNDDDTTWVERAKTSEVPWDYEHSNSATRNTYDENFRDTALQFIELIQTFASDYTEGTRRAQEYGDSMGYKELEGMTSENMTEKLLEAGTSCRYLEYVNAMSTYALMDAYPYYKAGETVVSKAELLDAETGQDATLTYTEDVSLAEYIMSIAQDEALEDHPSAVYNIISALSPAQTVVLMQNGLEQLVEGLYQEKDYKAQRAAAIQKAMQKIKDLGSEDGKIYLWSGFDNSIYEKKVVQTDASSEAKRAQTEYMDSVNQKAREESSTLNAILTALDITSLVIGVVTSIVSMAVGGLLTLGLELLSCAAICIAEGVIATAIGFALAGAVLAVLGALSYLGILIGIGLLVYNILKWTGVFDVRDTVDYTTIPDIVYDMRYTGTGNFSVRYDSVPSNATDDVLALAKKDFITTGGSPEWMKLIGTPIVFSPKYSELNAFASTFDRWVAMYYTKAPAAGNPIEVKPGEDPFITSSTPNAPAGYRPLSLIINSDAVNLNGVEIDVGSYGEPLYLYMYTGEISEVTATESSSSDTYITAVCLSYDTDRQVAINRLKAKYYDYFDTNLTPDNGYTFLGYQKGDRSNAITDIRISTHVTEPKSAIIRYGDAQYTKGGEDTKDSTTPYGLSLMYTKAKCAGTPIKELRIEEHRLEQGSGYEPANLFSGGDAVDFSHNWKENTLKADGGNPLALFTNIGATWIWETYADPSNHQRYAWEFIKDDDADKGLYIYFEPETKYLAADKDGNPAQQYIGGFSYFMACDSDYKNDSGTYGTHYDFMQSFAKHNGFELVEKDGKPITVMTPQAGEMTMIYHWLDVGGYPVDTYNFRLFHDLAAGAVLTDSNGGIRYSYGQMYEANRGPAQYFSRDYENMVYDTRMYFGVSYTYNPRRAITGVTGLITPYTETGSQLRYTGMNTPAGTFMPCNVSIQGSPITSPGISLGYFNGLTMTFPMYTNYYAYQKNDLPWMGKDENGNLNNTEVLSRYLLTSGATNGLLPLKREDIAIITEKNPGTMEGYVPISDLRTPGDKDHPMNFALETENMGSEYLYLYLKNDAGGRYYEKGTYSTAPKTDETTDETATETTPATTTDTAPTTTDTATDTSGEKAEKETEYVTESVSNVYVKKTYVAAIYCGVGKTPEAAIANLYSNMAAKWAELAKECSDISPYPAITELDEIIPVDLSNESPWYNLKVNQTDGVSSLHNGEWVLGNEFATFRWNDGKEDNHLQIALTEGKSADDTENTGNCAYIGVVRTNDSTKAAYGLLKYYTESDNAPSTLNTGSVKSILAGGPVLSKEGKYFLYYSPNGGTASYSAPITDLVVNDEMFINGYNPSLTVSESDRVNSALPAYSKLRKRTDEFKYIHLGYNRADLPYYEEIYIGVGNTKNEAYADLIGSSGAFGAVDVNCNYNSYSNKWIAIGYRRTNDFTFAITDVFFALTDSADPPDEITVKGYECNRKFRDYNITYTLVGRMGKNNEKEVVSLNDGNGGSYLYMYRTIQKNVCYDKKAEAKITPITNMCFAYGDISPRTATAQQLADTFANSYYGAKEMNTANYAKPIWECVLGVKGKPDEWKFSGEGATRFSLNEGIRPGIGNSGWHTGDSRVYMYVDRAYSNTKYTPRANAELPEFGYYDITTPFGAIKQVA